MGDDTVWNHLVILLLRLFGKFRDLMYEKQAGQYLALIKDQ